MHSLALKHGYEYLRNRENPGPYDTTVRTYKHPSGHSLVIKDYGNFTHWKHSGMTMDSDKDSGQGAISLHKYLKRIYPK